MNIVIAATGHRPSRLIGGWKNYETQHFNELTMFLVDFLQILNPKKARSGMSTGFDLCFARACLDIGIPVEAFIPYPGFSSLWNETDKYIYEQIMCAVDSSFYTSNTVPKNKAEAREILMQRNKDLVKDVDFVLALFDKNNKGGTYECLRHCYENGIEYTNIYSIYKTVFSQNDRQYRTK